jgi:hypothetical protein
LLENGGWVVEMLSIETKSGVFGVLGEDRKIED